MRLRRTGVATDFFAPKGYTGKNGAGRWGLTVYLELVMLLNAAVDFLLLQGTSRLAGRSGNLRRILAASALGAVYGGLSLLPELRFLGNGLWRTVSLALMAWLAFGWSRDTLRLGSLFLLLTHALGGFALCLGGRRASGLLPALALLWLLCSLGFPGGNAGADRLPLVIRHGDTRLRLTALRDTGNGLRDPITGERVLVLSAEAANALTGLTPSQLRSPLETMQMQPIPGLRLIPYRSVGGSGLLLGLRLDQVTLGSRQGSMIAAFAPEGLGEERGFQALTGGLD